MTVCLDEMGPDAAKSYPGHQLVHHPDGQQPAERAKQEIDYGRRGKGYTFGALKPVDGEVFTETYASRSAKNFVDFLEKVDQWLPDDLQVNAILDNLPAHRATDVLLFSLHHPRWQFVFQPKYAAYLNLIEPWWKILRSLALKGKRFELLGRDLSSCSGGYKILEPASSSFFLGSPPSSQTGTQQRCRFMPKCVLN